MQYRARRSATTAALAALLGSLAACGGGGAADSGGPAAPVPSLANASGTGPAAPSPAPSASTTPPAQHLQGRDFPVNASRAGDQGSASVAALAGGGFVAAWADLAAGSEPAIRLQRFDAQAQPAGGEATVSAFGSRPSVAALADGGFVVTWFRSPYQYGANAYAQRYDAQGAPVGGEVLLAEAYFKYVSRAMGLADGSFVLAVDTVTGRFGTNHGLVARFAADGTPLGQPVPLMSELSPPTGAYDPNSAGDTTTALAPDGSFVAAWVARGTDVSEVRLTRFDAQAAPVGATLPVARAASLQSPAVAVLADGQAAVAWVEGAAEAPKTVWLERLDAASGSSTGRMAIASGIDALSVQPRLAALADGGFVLAWNAVRYAGDTVQRELSVQRFDAAGHAVGPRGNLGSLAAPLGPFGAHHDSLDVVGTGGSGYLVLHGTHSSAEGWDVRGSLR